jgi:hypothetical protein
VAVAKFSLIGRSEAVKKGPINHEFVNLAAEFANISRTVIGKSDRVAESRDRARASRESRSIKYRPRWFSRARADYDGGRKKVKWDHGGKFKGRLGDVRTGLYGPTAFDLRLAERRDD